ncbi:ATP-binding cassette domain-containing protein [Microbaculum marinisediminis]
MRDGKVVDARPARDFTRTSLVGAMGSVAKEEDAAKAGDFVSKRTGAAPRVTARPPAQADTMALSAHRGEVVGLAGLEGHGQTAMLLQIYSAKPRTRARAGSRAGSQAGGGASVDAPVALVAGDRQTDGVFPLWSIARNIGIRSIRAMRRGPLIDPRQENEMAESWRARIKIRTPDIHDNILSLSGGNQQKALFARALGSDAEIVLMDDPMRGVDVGTKQEVYGIIRDEAAKGRTFVWYTTELDELKNCDHVYVFRNGRIVADLPRDQLTEEKVLQSSFTEDA